MHVWAWGLAGSLIALACADERDGRGARRAAPPGAVHGTVVGSGSDSVVDGLRVRAGSAVAGDSLLAWAVFRSPADTPVVLAWGACGFDLALYAGAGPVDSAAPPVFTADSLPLPSGARRGCPGYRMEARLRPGDSLAAPEYRLAVPLQRLAGSPLSPGRYRIMVLARPPRAAGAPDEDPRQRVRLPAGVLELSGPAGPPPSAGAAP